MNWLKRKADEVEQYGKPSKLSMPGKYYQKIVDAVSNYVPEEWWTNFDVLVEGDGESSENTYESNFVAKRKDGPDEIKGALYLEILNEETGDVNIRVEINKSIYDPYQPEKPQ